MKKSSLFSTPSPRFIVYKLFDDGHSGLCQAIPHCSFDLHFSDNYISLISIFSHVFLDISVSSSEKCPFRSSAYFFLIRLFLDIELHEMFAYFGA